MASILVHIESDGEHPRQCSLEALGDGRRIASILGATLYAHVQLEEPSNREHERRWLTELGLAGADLVVITPAADVAVEDAGGWSNLGHVLRVVCSTLTPTLILMSAGEVACAIAPRLAAALRSDVISEPDIVFEDSEVMLVRSWPGIAQPDSLPVSDLGRHAIVTVPSGTRSGARGPSVGSTVGSAVAHLVRVSLPEQALSPPLPDSERDT